MEDESILGDNIPRYLYKYRSLDDNSLEFTKRILSHRELYFSCPLDLNDPFEGHFSFNKERLQETVPELVDGVEKISEQTKRKLKIIHQLQEIRLKVRREFLQNIGIISFSARYDSPLMWSHYTNSHKGICIEIDQDVLIKTMKIGTLPVKYADDCLVAEHDDMESMQDAMVKSIYHKSKDWEYEKEWRAIRFQGKGTVVIPSESITGVILGSRIDEEIGQEIIDLAKSFSTPIKIGMASPDPFSYLPRVVTVGDNRGIYDNPDLSRPWFKTLLNGKADSGAPSP